MRLINTNLLNYFWKNGIKPIKEALVAKLDKDRIVNNLLATEPGNVLDAMQGKALADMLDEINSNLLKIHKDMVSFPVTTSAQTHTLAFNKIPDDKTIVASWVMPIGSIPMAFSVESIANGIITFAVSANTNNPNRRMNVYLLYF